MRTLQDTLNRSYATVEYWAHTGMIAPHVWDQYRALWRYSAPRFGAVDWDLPDVRAINLALDRGLSRSAAASDAMIETVRFRSHCRALRQD